MGFEMLREHPGGDKSVVFGGGVLQAKLQVPVLAGLFSWDSSH